MPSASPVLFHTNRSNNLFLVYLDAEKLSPFKTAELLQWLVMALKGEPLAVSLWLSLPPHLLFLALHGCLCSASSEELQLSPFHTHRQLIKVNLRYNERGQ